MFKPWGAWGERFRACQSKKIETVVVPWVDLVQWGQENIGPVGVGSAGELPRTLGSSWQPRVKG